MLSAGWRFGLKILFVSAEVDPFAKTGGLADVAGSLPRELSLLGHDIRVIMPKYNSIKVDARYITDLPVEIGDRKETCVIKESSILDSNNKEVPVYFIENYHYYGRQYIYCYHDDAERFLLLCKAALEMLPVIDFKPDIIHCNDWHTGPICLMLKEKYCKLDFFKSISTIFTVHNLEYQGNFNADTTKYLNLEEGYFTSEKAEFYGMFSFMKCGLVYSDIINTVSKQYAKEILTSAYGEKMEGVLTKRSKDLFGIVNGISYEEFDPSKDKSLYINFDSNSLNLKKKNKYALQEELGLARSDSPLIGIVTRLTGQKGLELVLGCIEDIIEQSNVQLVVLGLGDEYYHTAFSELQLKYPKNVAAYFEFNSDLAKKIYASSDMFLMPSRFEPCGLGQIISLRYGTIPIVRATGGLAETVSDFNDNNKYGNGFSFEEFSVRACKNAIERAIKTYIDTPKEWKELILRAASSDYSWKRPCREYLKLYETAISSKVEEVI